MILAQTKIDRLALPEADELSLYVMLYTVEQAMTSSLAQPVAAVLWPPRLKTQGSRNIANVGRRLQAKRLQRALLKMRASGREISQ